MDQIYLVLMRKKVAIFDIDGTIFRSSLLIELVKALIDRKIFPDNTSLEYGREYLAWLDRKGSYTDYITAVVNVFVKYIKGVKEDDLTSAAALVVTQQENHVYKYTRDLVKKLKDADYYLLAISHSPKLIVDGFAKSLGFDKVYGIMYEVNDSKKFTGKILDEELILSKDKILDRAVEKENLTLKDSVGVGDTSTDIIFLEKVTTPICFNPSSGLYKHAKDNAWKVVVERKDVIYEL